jgi:uncharacterized protein (DUF433 family)
MNRITIIPDVCNGKPTIRGLRITIKTILSHLAAGDTKEDILKAFPVLEAEDIDAALEYTAQLADSPLTTIPLSTSAR